MTKLIQTRLEEQRADLDRIKKLYPDLGTHIEYEAWVSGGEGIERINVAILDADFACGTLVVKELGSGKVIRVAPDLLNDIRLTDLS